MTAIPAPAGCRSSSWSSHLSWFGPSYEAGRRGGKLRQSRIGPPLRRPLDRDGAGTGQDGAVHALQRLRRLDAELLDQMLTHTLVCRQRLGLPVGAVQGEHELGPQTLAQRVFVDQR